jgi:hypothetical protein
MPKKKSPITWGLKMRTLDGCKKDRQKKKSGMKGFED